MDIPTQKIFNKVKKYAIYGFLVLALVLSILPAAVKAQNTNLNELTASLLKQIELLKQQIAELQAQVVKVEQQVQEIIKFTKTLRKGVTDEEVKRLQEFLKTDPEVYPEGLVTGYYGSLTEKAVKKFQEKHAEDVLKPLGLFEGTGVVGAKTIEKMNKVLEEAGKSGKVPPGLLRTQEETTTTVTTAPVTATPVSEEKITICHIPPENPSNKQTITIGKSALPAHLTHGDTVGVCPTEQPTTTVACTTDAKVCPDGSYVSRTAPKCEFALCPTQPAALYSINVISPNGGETWTTGSTQYIKWSTNIPITYKIMTIRLRDSLGVEYGLLADTTNDGVEQIIVPTTLAPGNYTLEIKTIAGDQTVFDKSDAPFSIVNPATPVPATPSADVTPPVISNTQIIQGETTNTSACMTVTWNTNEVSNSKLVYANHTLANQTNFMTSAYNNYDIVSHKLSGCSLSFGALYYFKVYSTDAAGNTAESGEQTFTPVAPVSSSPSVAPFITVVSPNGGETWYIGKTYDILWKSSGVERVNIEVLVFKDNISVGNLSIAGSDMITPASTGKYSWTPNSQHLKEGNQFKIVIRSAETPANGISAPEGESNNYFSIMDIVQPFITVVSPNGGEKYTTFQTEPMSVKWTVPCIDNYNWQPFIVSFYKAGNFVQTIPGSSSVGTCASGQTIMSYGWAWPIPATMQTGSDYKVRVSSGSLYDESDALFSISSGAATTAYLPDIEPFSLMTGHVYANESNSIGANFKNVGTAVLSQNFVIKYYVDGNYAGERESVNPSAPTTSGGSNTSIGSIAYTFTIPGNHEVKAVLDANNAVSEAYETNNTITRTVNMVTPSQTLADLEPVYMYPSYHLANQTNYIYVQLINRGATVAPKGFVVNLYVDGNYVGEKISGDLFPGTGTGIMIPYVFVGSGTHEVKVVVDATNLVVESSDENNILTQMMAMR